MKDFRLTSTLLALPLLLAATGESFAWSKTFNGTRDQVRAACQGPGMVLVENTQTNSTACGNDNNGTAVSCNDAGNCQGVGPGPMPRVVRSPNLDVVGTVLTLAVFKGAPAAPQSLTSGTSGGDDNPDAGWSKGGGGYGVGESPSEGPIG